MSKKLFFIDLKILTNFSNFLIFLKSLMIFYILLGIAKNFMMEPRSFSACYVDLYKLLASGSLELVHRFYLDLRT